MSIYQDLSGLCNNVLERAKAYQGENYAMNLGLKTGALDYMFSPLNYQGGVQVSGLSVPGEKLKKARVVYNTSALRADSVLSGTDAENAGLCDSATEPTPNEVIVDIDDAVAINPIEFSHAKLMQYCEDPDMFMREHLLDRLKAAREELDALVLNDLEAAAGANYGEDGVNTAAGATKDIDVLTADGLPNYPGFSKIIGDYENNLLTGIPAVIGMGKFAEFYRLQKLACCNSATPFTQSVEETGVAYFKDQLAPSELGAADEVLVVAPGAAQIITFNENDKLNMDTQLVKHIVMPDPVYGDALMWDIDFKWDECNKKAIWFARVYFTTFTTFQADSFASGAPRDNMTGIFLYSANKAS